MKGFFRRGDPSPFDGNHSPQKKGHFRPVLVGEITSLVYPLPKEYPRLGDAVAWARNEFMQKGGFFVILNHRNRIAAVVPRPSHRAT